MVATNGSSVFFHSCMDRPLRLPIIDEIALSAVDSVYDTGVRRNVFCSFMAREEIADLGNWLVGDLNSVGS